MSAEQNRFEGLERGNASSKSSLMLQPRGISARVNFPDVRFYSPRFGIRDEVLKIGGSTRSDYNAFIQLANQNLSVSHLALNGRRLRVSQARVIHEHARVLEGEFIRRQIKRRRERANIAVIHAGLI